MAARFHALMVIIALLVFFFCCLMYDILLQIKFQMGSKSQDDYPLSDNDEVVDRQEKAEDSNLFSGRCNMTGYSAEIRVRKGPEIKKSCYNILRNFQHKFMYSASQFLP